jgi:amidohydrolase
MRGAWPQRLVTLRRRLGRCAEPSGKEARTAEVIEGFFRRHGLGDVVHLSGGHGFFVRGLCGPGGANARRVVLRCELDGLPIPQTWQAGQRSITRGHSHRCGHDGHMAIVVATGVRCFLDPPPGVEPILLFQPAEETGEGALKIVEGQELAGLTPHMVMGFHNLPGVPMNEVVLRPGVFAAASCGWSARLTGRTSHAGEPEKGRSPTAAVLHLAGFLESLAQRAAALEEPVKATVIHLRVGQAAFGTSPGEAVVLATFRAWSDEKLDRVMREADGFAMRLAAAHDLGCVLSRHEPFPCTVSDPALTARLEDFLRRSGRPHRVREAPFPWSEDFGRYASLAPLLFFGLGAGMDAPALHHPEYVFPDALILEASEMIHDLFKDLSSWGDSPA